MEGAERGIGDGVLACRLGDAGMYQCGEAWTRAVRGESGCFVSGGDLGRVFEGKGAMRHLSHDGTRDIVDRSAVCWQCASAIVSLLALLELFLDTGSRNFKFKI